MKYGHLLFLYILSNIVLNLYIKYMLPENLFKTSNIYIVDISLSMYYEPNQTIVTDEEEEHQVSNRRSLKSQETTAFEVPVTQLLGGFGF